MDVIGIPRGLYYFHYQQLWKCFLEELGFKVVFSEPTNQNILESGLLACVDGSCLPIKAYVGHALNLVESGVDQLFIPRIVSVWDKEYICVNFLGLPDLVAQYVPEGTKLISPVLDGLKGPKRLQKSYFNFALEYASPRQVKQSWRRALEAQQKFEQSVWEKQEENLASNLKLLLLGPRYLTDDTFLNGQLILKLNRLGATVVTPAQLGLNSSKSLGLNNSRKPLFWSGPRRSLQALEMIEEQISGIISVSSFGCGTESLVGVLVDQLAKDRTIPRLELQLDEHTSALGVLTRLEAFYDLLERKFEYETNVSPFG